jgi:hypothetical protein
VQRENRRDAALRQKYWRWRDKNDGALYTITLNRQMMRDLIYLINADLPPKNQYLSHHDQIVFLQTILTVQFVKIIIKATNHELQKNNNVTLTQTMQKLIDTGIVKIKDDPDALL